MTSSAIVPHIEVTSNSGLIDEPVCIRLSGFEADQFLTLKAQTQDDYARKWEAYATFSADMHGCVDVQTRKPLSGTYEDADPMGLFWSMTPGSDERKNLLFAKSKVTPVTIKLTVEVEGQQVIGAEVERLLASPEVVRYPLREVGLFGTFFYPGNSTDPLPGVIVLGGSSGGLRESRAALLASHGYATLALAYFAFEQLPQSLVNIPLEYFETALSWLRAQPQVNGDRLAVMGQSKGGELALLLGATFSQIKAVVAYVPSSVVWQGLSSSDAEMQSNPSSWSYRQQPLPYVPYVFSRLASITGEPMPSASDALSFTSMYLDSLSDSEAVERATIPVEKTQGSILLISAQDDQLWPSTHFCEMVMERLAAHKYPYQYQHLSYKGAGHLINFPYLPVAAAQALHSLSGTMLAYGGNSKDNAFADVDSWSNVLAFLAQHLK